MKNVVGVACNEHGEMWNAHKIFAVTPQRETLIFLILFEFYLWENFLNNFVELFINPEPPVSVTYGVVWAPEPN